MASTPFVRVKVDDSFPERNNTYFTNMLKDVNSKRYSITTDRFVYQNKLITLEGVVEPNAEVRVNINGIQQWIYLDTTPTYETIIEASQIYIANSIKTVTANNGYIDFKEDMGSGIGPELHALIPPGKYMLGNSVDDDGSLCKAIKTALESLGQGTYSVNYEADFLRFFIVASGVTELQLLWGTGVNNANNMASLLGLSHTDLTGSDFYIGVDGSLMGTEYLYTFLQQPVLAVVDNDIIVEYSSDSDPFVVKTPTTDYQLVLRNTFAINNPDKLDLKFNLDGVSNLVRVTYNHNKLYNEHIHADANGNFTAQVYAVNDTNEITVTYIV